MDVSGYIPLFLAKKTIPATVSGASVMREKFKRDIEIDEVERCKQADVIKHSKHRYKAEELQLIARVQGRLGSLKDEDLKELDSPDHLVKMYSSFKKKGSTAIGRAITVRTRQIRPGGSSAQATSIFFRASGAGGSSG
jgi:hypothetical protein